MKVGQDVKCRWWRVRGGGGGFTNLDRERSANPSKSNSIYIHKVVWLAYSELIISIDQSQIHIKMWKNQAAKWITVVVCQHKGGLTKCASSQLPKSLSSNVLYANSPIFLCLSLSPFSHSQVSGFYVFGLKFLSLTLFVFGVLPLFLAGVPFPSRSGSLTIWFVSPSPLFHLTTVDLTYISLHINNKYIDYFTWLFNLPYQGHIRIYINIVKIWYWFHPYLLILMWWVF